MSPFDPSAFDGRGLASRHQKFCMQTMHPAMPFECAPLFSIHRRIPDELFQIMLMMPSVRPAHSSCLIILCDLGLKFRGSCALPGCKCCLSFLFLHLYFFMYFQIWCIAAAGKPASFEVEVDAHATTRSKRAASRRQPQTLSGMPGTCGCGRPCIAQSPLPRKRGRT